jgi:tellurite resistance protein TehA-like permease
MKPGALFDWLYDRIGNPYDARWTAAHCASMGVTQAARVVGMLAPAEAVQDYVHTVMRGERALEWWKQGFSAVGSLMPMIFMIAGQYLNGSIGWWIFAAQCVWLFLWTFVGLPWLFYTITAQQLELRANALTAMCERSNATQEQLNRAAQRLDMGE